MTNNNDPIEDLREHVTKLKSLLDDPHPGLVSWCMAYAEQMDWLRDFWAGKFAKNYPEFSLHIERDFVQ